MKKANLKVPVDRRDLRDMMFGVARQLLATAPPDRDHVEKCIAAGVLHGLGVGLHLYGRVDITCPAIAEVMHNTGPQGAAEHLLKNSVMRFPRENSQHGP